MVTRCHFFPLLMLLACYRADGAAAGDAASARDQAMIAKLNQQPLIFFIAKGRPDACGQGCNEWIAADGMIDPNAAQRFREFLDQTGSRGLPVFFNSLGGSASQAIAIGLTLRQYRMTAGVGRSFPNSCHAAKPDECRRIAQSKPEQEARLITFDAHCASGCVYALLGASVRKVARYAQLGIHSPRYVGPLKGPEPPSPPSIDIVDDELRGYVVEMGEDPGLIDAAADVSPDRIHWMSREEIERFGIETHGYFETPWTAHQETAKRYVISKSWTREDTGAGGGYYTTVIRLGCSNSFGYVLAYRSELPFASTGDTQVRVATAGSGLQLTRLPANSDRAVWYATVDRSTMQRTATEPKLGIMEARGATDSRAFDLSTDGLSEALGRLQQHCDERREIRSP